MPTKPGHTKWRVLLTVLMNAALIAGIAAIGCARAKPMPLLQSTTETSDAPPAHPIEGDEEMSTTDSNAEPIRTEYNELSPTEAHVIVDKGTERAFVGEYTDLKDPGTFVCRRCNAPLYKSTDKFERPDTCGANQHQHLVGRPRTEIPVPLNPERQRVACDSCPITQDYSPDRLNFFFDAASGRITKVSCG